MAEFSALCLFSAFPSFSTPSSSPTAHTNFLAFSRYRRRNARFLRLGVHCSNGGLRPSGDDSFGFYIQNGDSTIHWVPEDRITLFTSEGLYQIGGSMVPHQVPSSNKQQRSNSSQRLPRYRESDYMDPRRGICLGALFDIAATNGLDMGRRLCFFGFCSSIEMLSDVVEDIVMEQGGEVVAAEKASEGGLQEKLTMKVAVPLLWGVPPASETLHLAVKSGGGIIDKVCLQWDYL